MAMTSITRLRLRSERFLPDFEIQALRSERQVQRSEGFVAGYVASGPQLTFWTVTVWRDQESIRGFRRTGDHLQAMPKLADWCDEAAYAAVADGTDTPPAAADAARLLQAQGQLSKVRHPSPAQARGELWPDLIAPKVGRAFGPA